MQPSACHEKTQSCILPNSRVFVNVLPDFVTWLTCHENHLRAEARSRLVDRETKKTRADPQRALLKGERGRGQFRRPMACLIRRNSKVFDRGRGPSECARQCLPSECRLVGLAPALHRSLRRRVFPARAGCPAPPDHAGCRLRSRPPMHRMRSCIAESC